MQVKYRVEEKTANDTTATNNFKTELSVARPHYTGCLYITINPEVQTIEDYHAALLRSAVTLRNALPRLQRLGNNTFYTMLTPQDGDPSEWESLSRWALAQDLNRYRLPVRLKCMTSRRQDGEALDALLLRAAHACQRCSA